MTTVMPRLLTYKEIRQRLRAHYLRQSEVPMEYSVSLPLPTLRGGQPGYACFAAGGTRTPGQPVTQAPPDRWWVLDATSARLLIYALTRVYPFGSNLPTESQTLPAVAGTLEEMQQKLNDVEARLEVVTPAFFGGEAGAGEQKQAALAALQAFLPAPLLPQYQELAPDFFAWLQQG